MEPKGLLHPGQISAFMITSQGQLRASEQKGKYIVQADFQYIILIRRLADGISLKTRWHLLLLAGGCIADSILGLFRQSERLL